MQMVDMAVEACVSSLVFTGFVHADPHAVLRMKLQQASLKQAQRRRLLQNEKDSRSRLLGPF